MTSGKSEYMNEIFRLLCEQRELLNRWPYSSEQIREDEEISVRIDELVDQICAGQSIVKFATLPKVHFEEEDVCLRRQDAVRAEVFHKHTGALQEDAAEGAKSTFPFAASIR